MDTAPVSLTIPDTFTVTVPASVTAPAPVTVPDTFTVTVSVTASAVSRGNGL